MKKVLALLFGCFIALGAAKAMADARSEALNANPQMIDDMDLIFLYPNLATDFKNTFDVRTDYLSTTNVWGGLLDGEHTDLGVIGAYVNRPVGYDGGRAWNFNGPGWGGVGSGWAAYQTGNGLNLFGNNLWTAPTVTGVTTHFTAPTPENKADVFWASNLDSKSNIGVQINYADNQPNGGDPGATNQSTNTSNNDPAAFASSTTGTDDARTLGLNLGLGLSGFGPFDTADFHVGYFLTSLDMEQTDSPTAGNTKYDASLKDKGISTATLGLLLKHNLDENSDMRVFANAYLDQNDQHESILVDVNDSGYHNNAGDFDQEWNGNYNDIMVDLGAGCHHKVLDGKAVISTGLEAVWANSDTKMSGTTQDGTATTTTYVAQDAGPGGFDEQTMDEWSVQWNANVEAKVADWLTLRAGINRPIVDRLSTVSTVNTYNADGSVNHTAKTTTVSDNYFGGNANTYSTGFGINWENWELDGVVSTGSVFGSIGSVAPGNGVFFTNGNAIVTVYDADIRYRF